MFRIVRRLGVASLVAVIATMSGALAQAKPDWVDPPAQADSAPERALPAKEEAPAQESPPAVPAASQPKSTETPKASPTAEPKLEVTPAKTPAAPVASAPSRRSSTRAAFLRPRPAKALRHARATAPREMPARVRSARRVEPARERTASVPAAAPRRVRSTGLLNLRRLRAAMPARTPRRAVAVAVRTPRAMQRPATVRQALRSGFQVMRVRTLEYPDGRRVTIMSRPDPDTLRDLAARY